ncbi:MAG TPA: tetratricopeptide repeat protein [Candidatus Limnocylindrales bacterium]|nr:tetratricopeptide repeat protein [Candidatus Limnocylindrales bacterium]
MRRPHRALLPILLALCAPALVAQTQQVHQPEDLLSVDNITVHVYGPDHTPFKHSAFVTLYQRGSSMQLGTVMTTVSGDAILSGMPGYGPYTVSVTAAGFETATKDFEYNAASGRVEVDVTLHALPAPGSTNSQPSPEPPLDPKTQEHVQKGLAAMQSGKFDEAQKEFIEARKHSPQNAQVCYLLGAAYQKGKDLKNAQLYLEKAVSIDPDHVQALVALGQLHDQQKDYAAAIPPLEKAATLDGKEWLARWVLADAYLRTGQPEKAAKSAQAAVELGNGSANKAQLIQGEALAQLGRRDDAIKALQSFLHDEPNDPAAPAVQKLVERLQSAPNPK